MFYKKEKFSTAYVDCSLENIMAVYDIKFCPSGKDYAVVKKILWFQRKKNEKQISSNENYSFMQISLFVKILKEKYMNFPIKNSNINKIS